MSAEIVKVPCAELTFAWDHSTKPSTCTIRHAEKVVFRGTFLEADRLFQTIQSYPPGAKISVQYEKPR